MKHRVNAVVYDVEIVNCIAGKDEVRDPKYKYCGGWGDFKGMGVAVVCAIDMLTGDSRIFLEDNLRDFQSLVLSRDCVIGFNSIAFDDPLMQANDIAIKTGYDFKIEAMIAAKGSKYDKGRKLDDYAQLNLGASKPMSGGLAPKLWQDGKRGQVIDYCMNDVILTAKLALMTEAILDPVTRLQVKLKDIPSLSPQLIMNEVLGVEEMVQ
jgi:hypothetical protein